MTRFHYPLLLLRLFLAPTLGEGDSRCSRRSLPLTPHIMTITLVTMPSPISQSRTQLSWRWWHIRHMLPRTLMSTDHSSPPTGRQKCHDGVVETHCVAHGGYPAAAEDCLQRGSHREPRSESPQHRHGVFDGRLEGSYGRWT
jgi:hypothetical protein